ncbi:glutamine--fructose-6-phosphate aminotransferase [Candidatus Gottesmanbacteria bacterium RBG_16_52_11]|uniref:Glutamine--fructose-6-phosphate aminotransferase [isomerizing] n=1 Tax=Candidatus Gottesmanbacteria bacterium RBG_16_52_11 TaxID=1798374 RepID=A0A1F5YPK8_9BACT|nr:MAG: glutamine--fructose-6-phosphate aminotransferase [Candidatus Gottesmanbacteria bacterium RBG_16_52_11]
MCGIFGYVGHRKDAACIVLEGLKSLEYRGYDSWGIAVLPESGKSDGKIIVRKKTGKIGDATADELPAGSIAFGHTRWATHGGVTQANAHPHLDCTGKLALIHNGILENYHEIKPGLKKGGHRFISDTDTETFVHMVEEYSRNRLVSKAMQRAFNEVTGLNAFIILAARDKRLIAARNGSPLVVGYGDNENFIASDASALLPYTRQVHFLEENQMAIVSGAGIMIFDAKTGDLVEPHKQVLTWSIDQTVKGKYPYFMLKEIHEQPGVLAAIAADYTSQAEKLAATIDRSYGTYMVGCGTAAYACMAGSYLFSKIAKRHVNWAIGSEFTYQAEFLTPKSLVIALSQSGETMDTLEAVRKAKEKGASIYAVVNALGSSLYRYADHKMLIGAGPEKGVASTKAFTGKLAHLIMVAYAMEGSVKNGQKVVTAAAKSSQKVLTESSVRQLKELALKFRNVRHMYVIGRGLSYPASLETALKIKEISYIHAEGLAAGELKHGPLALVEKGTACIAFLPNDETYGANLAGAMEMKARGGYIIGASYKPHEIFDTYVHIPDAGEGTIIPNVIFGQMLAYELAVIRGLDPDKPRNLAKSVTVK